ncbi:MAG: Asr1405/Asl0597 family protein [Almyronema sp.]
MDSVQPDLSSLPQLDRIERWNIYNRLQELAILCHCAKGQPLQVQINTVTELVQLWSVIQQFTAPRQTQLAYIERCWQQAEAA